MLSVPDVISYDLLYSLPSFIPPLLILRSSLPFFPSSVYSTLHPFPSFLTILTFSVIPIFIPPSYLFYLPPYSTSLPSFLLPCLSYRIPLFLLTLTLLTLHFSLPSLLCLFRFLIYLSFSSLFFLTQVILRLSLQPFFSLHYACFSPSLLSKCIFFHFSLCNLIFHLFLRVYILFLLSSSSSPVFPSIPIFLTINFSPPFLHPYLIPFPYALLQSLVLSLLLLSFIPYSLIRSVHEACVYSFVLYHYFAAVLT